MKTPLIFPLIPYWRYRSATEHNTAGFTFRWLLLTIWTLDHPAFEVSVVADTHWGIGIIGILPYLRWSFTIPCPERFGMWISRKLGRKPVQPNEA